MNNNINPTLITELIESGLDNAPEMISGFAKLLNGNPHLSLVLFAVCLGFLAYILKQINKTMKLYIRPYLEQKHGIKFPKTTGEKITNWAGCVKEKNKLRKKKIKDWWQKLKRKDSK